MWDMRSKKFSEKVMWGLKYVGLAICLISNFSNLISFINSIVTKMNKLNELKIWNKAIELTVDVYKATASFPSDERFGLTSQSRRAAVSIPSNIAEGGREKFYERI